MFFRIELLLVHNHIHFFDQQTICRDFVTLIKQDNIAHHQLTCRNLLSNTILTSQHECFLLVDLSCQSPELALFCVVT